MVSFSNPAYTVILGLQMLHLAVDLLCNTATIFIGTSNPLILMVLYLIQDIGILFAAVLLFLIFFSTYIFKAGLISILLKKFFATLAISAIYLTVTLGYHIWSIALQWETPNSYIWSGGLQAVYVLQKLLAVIYFYLYKRAALRLGNSKYYEDSDWLRKQLTSR